MNGNVNCVVIGGNAQTSFIAGPLEETPERIGGNAVESNYYICKKCYYTFHTKEAVIKHICMANLDRLRGACQEYLDFLDSDNYNEDGLGNMEHNIFEAAMEAFHGEDVWETVNSKI